jgi:hypothetical protein
MDLFWSGLAMRASEHIWNERKSQFNKVHEIAFKDVISKRQTCIIDVIT